MAVLTLRDEKRVLNEPGAIAALLADHGIHYRRVDDPPRLRDEASDDEILAAYGETVEKARIDGGYRTADVIRIRPDTPDLEALLAKFDREHTHDEDEVRLLVDGRGLFHLHPEGGPVLSVEVEAGDLLAVPRGTRHWFHVCPARRCTAVRLFQDAAGWTPHYTGSGVDRAHPPVWHAAE